MLVYPKNILLVLEICQGPIAVATKHVQLVQLWHRRDGRYYIKQKFKPPKMREESLRCGLGPQRC